MNAMSNPNFMQGIHRQRRDSMAGARQRHGLVGRRHPVPVPASAMLLTFPSRSGPPGELGHASAGVA